MDGCTGDWVDEYMVDGQMSEGWVGERTNGYIHTHTHTYTYSLLHPSVHPPIIPHTHTHSFTYILIYNI